MSGPDSEEAAGPVVPQPPVVSNYGLVLTVYILYLVGFLTGITVLQNGSGVPIAFSVSDNNVLDWASVFFRWASDAPHWNRRTNLALVCHLDGG